MPAFHEDGTLPADPRAIFVFGSNLAGAHGGGAAKVATERFGAQDGAGIGRTGRAYAIPTVSRSGKPLALPDIAFEVDAFLDYTRRHPGLRFFVTRVGCVLAGLEDRQIAPLFENAPANCSLPEPWRRWVE